jgi:hypothetical protein
MLQTCEALLYHSKRVARTVSACEVEAADFKRRGFGRYVLKRSMLPAVTEEPRYSDSS